MGLSTSLNSALTGLQANSRASEVVSSNIANVRTPGYATRDLLLTSRATGQGVQIVGVNRQSNPVLTAERRLAEAGSGNGGARAAFLTRIEGALGAAEKAGSLTARIAAFDAALLAAAANPESDAHLEGVATTARSLAGTLNAAAETVQAARTGADADIAAQVGRLNTAMDQVADLNEKVLKLSIQGRDTSALLDQRQRVIDAVATIVPLREVPRENGQIALYTGGGTLLVERGTAYEIGFSGSATVTADMTLASGALSGLRVNGKPVSTGEGAGFGGGSLTAAFAVRDGLGPEAQVQLDAMARDLVERFSGLDPTLAPGAPGLFTDAGGAFAATAETGLAQRLSLNAAADPESGGALWRLRDGLGAATPGPVGNGSLLTRLEGALTAARPTASGGLVPGSRSFAGLAADILSTVATRRIAGEGIASLAAARTAALRSEEAANGVDTDVELQNMLLIEQAWAANAKVIQAVDTMIQSLLEI